ncbi:uncharacterized protein LOC111713184, partial [Eurytemora carolleeae]|uniref:uncharacterized protein LOC111713184 n=1 Tax=Eurytemora carolleeae TaxID=1294199 RepID=UPI000C791876
PFLQTTPHDLTIDAEKTDDGSVNIKVSAKTPFKGILITSTAAGQFKVPDGQPLKIMSCTGITHTDNEPKSEISATFVKTDPSAEAEFNMIVMRDFETYWNDIKFS